MKQSDPVIDAKTRMLMAAVFLLPLWMTGSLIALGGFALLRLLSKEERKGWWKSIREPGWHWVLPVFFLVHLIGMLWSSNLSFGFKDLETKLSLLLLPFLLSAIDQRSTWAQIRTAFIGGSAIACLFLLFRALQRYLELGHGLTFFYVELSSPLMHPTYMSMLINLVLLFLIQRLADGSVEHKSGYMIGGCLIFFWLMLDLLSARMPFLVTLITCSGFLLQQIVRKSITRSWAFMVTTSMVAGLAGMVMASAYTGRVNEVSQAIRSSSPAATTYNSTTGRIEIWKQGIGLLPDALPWGTGTGDVKDALLDSYRTNGFAYGLDRALNAHNQYLQTTLALGIPGLICLSLIVVFPLLSGKKRNDPVLLWFTLLIGMNAAVESMLEVQRGVMMAALFIPLLMSLGHTSEREDGMP